jgi:hypothetical protein
MLLVTSMISRGSGAGVLAAGSSGATGRLGIISIGRPAGGFGIGLSREGIAIAVMQAERCALMCPNGASKALALAILWGLQLCTRQHGEAM